MAAEDGSEPKQLEPRQVVPVTWFRPTRPTDGTIFVRPPMNGTPADVRSVAAESPNTDE
jgi:hypothetical protein